MQDILVRSAFRFGKFSIVGASGIGVSTITLWLLHSSIGLNLTVAGILTHTVAATSNYILNCVWTFEDRKVNLVKGWFGFQLSSLVQMTIYLTILNLLTNLGVYYLISSLIGIIVAAPVNYTLCYLGIWRAK